MKKPKVPMNLKSVKQLHNGKDFLGRGSLSVKTDILRI